MATSSTEIAELIERQIASAPANQRAQSMSKMLMGKIEEIRTLVPQQYREVTERIIQQSMLYFRVNDRLHECTTSSFVLATIQALEYGLPIDGRLAHAVPFNCKVSKKGEPDRWESQVKFMPDWKGLVAVVKRNRHVKEIRSESVYEKDSFSHGRSGPNVDLQHTWPVFGDRGQFVGVYCILTFHDGRWDYVMMSKAEIDKVRASSKSKDNGPWVTWYEEMAKKTVVKRALKNYVHDTELNSLLDVDHSEYVKLPPPSNVKVSSLNLVLQGKSDPAVEQQATASVESQSEQPDKQVRNTDQEKDEQDASQPVLTREQVMNEFKEQLAKAKTVAEIAQLFAYYENNQELRSILSEGDMTTIEMECETKSNSIKAKKK